MPAARRDVLIAVAGAVLGAGAASLWGDLASVPAAAVLGGALGASRPHPTATWLAAAALLVLVAATGGDGFASYLLVGAHAFAAGRWDSRTRGYAAVATLVAAGVVSTVVAGGAVVPYLFIPPAMWAAGQALRERELVAAELALRARELEDEREAYAQLSVRYERARIASELHDIVAHAISVMVVQATAGQRLVAHDPEATAATFRAIAGAARQAESDMQRLVALLREEPGPAGAPDLALVTELVERANGSGLDVELRLEGNRDRLDAAVAQTACRVVQEGLTNALRYAAGARVAAVVRGEPDTLVVEIRNGPASGDAALAGSGTGNGLRGLRERIDASGGTLHAAPTLDGGWLLAARLPRRLEAQMS